MISGLNIGWIYRFLIPLIGLNLADKVGLEAAGRIVPLEALAVAIPQLQAVLLLPILVAEIVRLAGVPVGEGYWPAGGHPEEGALIGQVSAGNPEMLVAQSWKLNQTS